jgi:hypothetical protein
MAEREPSTVEIAGYIADLSGDLAQLARSHGLDMLGYLLEMARMEAQNTLAARGPEPPAN